MPKYLMRKWMDLFETSQTYYHGSNTEMRAGDILRGRHGEYESDWGDASFYAALEIHRPDGMLSHRESVFMVSNEDDIDLAGGGTEYVFTMRPLSPRVERHDINWASEISSLVDDGHDFDSEAVRTAAMNYWNGVPHHNESVWEYLTPDAEIITVEDF